MLKSLSEIKEEGWIALVERLGISGDGKVWME